MKNLLNSKLGFLIRCLYYSIIVKLISLNLEIFLLKIISLFILLKLVGGVLKFGGIGEMNFG